MRINFKIQSLAIIMASVLSSIVLISCQGEETAGLDASNTSWFKKKTQQDRYVFNGQDLANNLNSSLKSKKLNSENGILSLPSGNYSLKIPANALSQLGRVEFYIEGGRPNVSLLVKATNRNGKLIGQSQKKMIGKKIAFDFVEAWLDQDLAKIDFSWKGEGSVLLRKIKVYRPIVFDTGHHHAVAGEIDPFDYDKTLSSNGTKIGISSFGGGYISYIGFAHEGFKNRVEAGYGRGIQSAIRDYMHRYRYNPTQAGFRDPAGTPVKIQTAQKSLRVLPYQLVGYNDCVYDMLRFEDLAPDCDLYMDGNQDDIDEVDEEKLGLFSQDDELRTEFDYEGTYEDASGLSPQSKASVFRHVYRYAYVRNPSQIKQYINGTVTRHNRNVDLGPVFVEEAQVDDISSQPGIQAARKTDLSLFKSSYALRIKKNQLAYDYAWFLKSDQKSWEVVTMNNRNTIRTITKNPKLMAKFSPEILEEAGASKSVGKTSNLALLATTGDVNSSKPAIGLYFPHRSKTNRQSIVGESKTSRKEIYREDRSMTCEFLATKRINLFGLLNIQCFLTGQMSPEHPFLKSKNAIEAFEQEVFILSGSPQEILKAVRSIESKL